MRQEGRNTPQDRGVAQYQPGIQTAKRSSRGAEVGAFCEPSGSNRDVRTVQIPEIPNFSAATKVSYAQSVAEVRNERSDPRRNCQLRQQRNPISIVKRDGTEWSPPSPWRGNRTARNKGPVFSEPIFEVLGSTIKDREGEVTKMEKGTRYGYPPRESVEGSPCGPQSLDEDPYAELMALVPTPCRQDQEAKEEVQETSIPAQHHKVERMEKGEVPKHMRGGKGDYQPVFASKGMGLGKEAPSGQLEVDRIQTLENKGDKSGQVPKGVFRQDFQDGKMRFLQDKGEN